MPLLAPFPGAATAADVAAGVDLSGKRALVTGGASGIGLETVRVLADCGADVTITSRDPAASARAAAAVRRQTGNLLVHPATLDLSDRGSIHRFLDSWWSPLDILVNNETVVLLGDLTLTADGWEAHLGTNFFGHFQITVGLYEHLAAADQGARVVSVSSSRHLFSPLVFDDINFDYRPYDPVIAHGQSMTATALLAVAVGNRWASAGVTANALNPGRVGREGPAQAAGGLAVVVPAVAVDASTTVLVAVSPLLDGVSGRYFEDCREAAPTSQRGPGLQGVAPYAIDPDNADRLWAHATRWL